MGRIADYVRTEQLTREKVTAPQQLDDDRASSMPPMQR